MRAINRNIRSSSCSMECRTAWITGSPSFNGAQRPEHLIRTVMSGNLRGEQQFDTVGSM